MVSAEPGRLGDLLTRANGMGAGGFLGPIARGSGRSGRYVIVRTHAVPASPIAARSRSHASSLARSAARCAASSRAAAAREEAEHRARMRAADDEWERDLAAMDDAGTA